MRNYKILVIILLAISITVITSISHAQISEQIPSPKKQIDNGVAPHDVICRGGLVLVDRGADKVSGIRRYPKDGKFVTYSPSTSWHVV